MAKTTKPQTPKTSGEYREEARQALEMAKAYAAQAKDLEVKAEALEAEVARVRAMPVAPCYICGAEPTYLELPEGRGSVGCQKYGHPFFSNFDSLDLAVQCWNETAALRASQGFTFGK